MVFALKMTYVDVKFIVILVCVQHNSC